jgi:Zn-dependent protease
VIGRASLRLGKIGPVEVNVNVTWLAIFALLTYWLRFKYISEVAPGLGGYTAWAVSLVGAVLLFASVLAHELSHSFVALRHGLSIRRITLFIFGGVAHMESEPRSPGVELRMALAGPIASLLIAAVCLLVRGLVVRAGGRGAIPLVLQYAFMANLALGTFNLIPGFPLDGGRVLRALLWRLTGSFSKSTAIAAGAGRVFGLVMVFGGVTLAVGADMPVFFWPALVGAFLERLAFLSGLRARPLRRPAGRDEEVRFSATPLPEYHTDEGPQF